MSYWRQQFLGDTVIQILLTIEFTTRYKCPMRVLLLVIFGFVLAVRAIHYPQQTISYKNNFSAASIRTLGGAIIDSGSLVLTANAPSQASAVFYNASRFAIGSGFYSAVNITVDSCDSGNGGYGFTLFLTSDVPTQTAVSTAVGDQLGIGNMTNVYMAGYSTTDNKFYGCSWFSFSRLWSQCPSSVNTEPVFGCLERNTSLFEFYFSTSDSMMRIYYGGQLQFNKTLEIPPGFYYVGISGSTGLSYYRQIVNSWSFKSNATDFPFTTVHLNYSRNFDSNEGILLGASKIENGSLIVTPAKGSQGGAWIYRLSNDTDPRVGIWGDFNASLVIDWQNCSQIAGGSDGFSLFLTPDLPNVTDVLNANGGGLGVKLSNNIYMTGYSSTFDKILACHWAVPPTSSLQYYCPSLLNGDDSYSCNGEPYAFEFYYNSTAKTMTVSVNGTIKASLPFEIPNGLYYLGISGATGAEFFKQTVTSWTFMNDIMPVLPPITTPISTNQTSSQLHFPPKTFSFSRNFNNSAIRTLGNAQVVSGSVVLTNSAAQQASAVIYGASRMAISSGFTSAIKINVDKCDEDSNGGDGFTLFLTPDVPTGDGFGLSSGSQLGIGGIPNVYMAGYSTITDMFFTCSWFSKTPVQPFYDLCPYEYNTGTTFDCRNGNNSLFEFSYSNSTMRIYLNGKLQLNRTLEIPPGFYYVGISGSTGLSYYRQIVQSWNFTTYGADFDYEIVHLNRSQNFKVNESLLLGASKIENGSLILTPANPTQAGAFIYKPANITNAKVGIFGNFYSSITIDWRDCSTNNGGAEGFLLFLTRDLPDAKNVSNAVGKKLGLQFSTNIYATGYSRRFENLLACNWATSPPTDPLSYCPTIINYASFFTCEGQSSLFEFYYDAAARQMTIRTNGADPISPIDFDVPYGYYYLGIAGSTGSEFFKQTISSWTFTNDPKVSAPPAVDVPEAGSYMPETANRPIPGMQTISLATIRSGNAILQIFVLVVTFVGLIVV